jgi:hypothetical protein
MAKLYAVLAQEKRPSKYGGMIVKITMVGVLDRKEYHTYIDPLNLNIKNWAHIINNPDDGFILTDLRLKRGSEDLINADSEPVIDGQYTDINVMLDLLQQIWAKQDKANNPHRFSDLFG